jgi:hypothetical protein
MQEQTLGSNLFFQISVSQQPSFRDTYARAAYVGLIGCVG